MKPFTKSQVKRIFSQLGRDPEVISCTKDFILVRFYEEFSILKTIERVFNAKKVEISGGDCDGLELTIILKE